MAASFGFGALPAPEPPPADPTAPPPPDGTNAPIDGAPTKPPSPYGPNFETLPANLQGALVDLIKGLEKEQYGTRLQVIRRCMKARLYWGGNQEIAWDDALGTYRSGSINAVGDSDRRSGSDAEGAGGDLMVIRNIYRPHGLGITAALAAQKPTTRVWPADASKTEDVETSRAASDVIDFCERNNDIQSMQIEQNFLLWTDGMVAGYVRFVVDETRFGATEEPILEQEQFEAEPAKALCTTPGCPQPENLPPGPQNPTGLCDGCAGQLDQANVKPAVTGTRTIQTGTAHLPNGQERAELNGHLEIEVPYSAKKQEEFPFIFWKTEFHETLLKATYSHVAKAISSQGSGGPEDEVERYARMGPRSDTFSGMSLDDRQKQITLKRCWLRPWVFLAVEGDLERAQLQQLYPRGCYVAIAGQTYCESRNESIDDHWRVMHALPGVGQNRSGLGDDLIPIQDEKNTIVNAKLDALEHSIPTKYLNVTMVDPKHVAGVSIPGQQIPFKTQPGQSASDVEHTGASVSLSPQVAEQEKALMSDAELVSGDFAALQGTTEANIDTASGYRMAQNAAKGRLILPWTAIVRFWADMAVLFFECFKANRQSDVTVSLLGEDGEWKSKTIALINLRGSIHCRPEGNSAYPVSWMEKSSAFKELLSSPNPAVGGVLTDPANLAAGKRYLGLDDIEIPGDEDRNFQLREIEDMKEGEPVDVNQLLDNHQVHLKVIQEWYATRDAQNALTANPMFKQAIQQHAAMHQQAMMPPPMPGPGGAPEGPPGAEQGPPGPPPVQ